MRKPVFKCLRQSRKLIAKAPIRLCGCSDLSVPMMLAYGKNRFSHDVSHCQVLMIKFYNEC